MPHHKGTCVFATQKPPRNYGFGILKHKWSCQRTTCIQWRIRIVCIPIHAPLPAIHTPCHSHTTHKHILFFTLLIYTYPSHIMSSDKSRARTESGTANDSQKDDYSSSDDSQDEYDEYEEEHMALSTTGKYHIAFFFAWFLFMELMFVSSILAGIKYQYHLTTQLEILFGTLVITGIFSVTLRILQSTFNCVCFSGIFSALMIWQYCFTGQSITWGYIISSKHLVGIMVNLITTVVLTVVVDCIYVVVAFLWRRVIRHVLWNVFGWMFDTTRARRPTGRKRQKRH